MQDRMAGKPRILVAGSINMDMVLRLKRIPLPGESYFGSDYLYLPGGKGANQAIAAALLNAQVFFAGKAGRDEHGRRLAQELKDRGIDTEYFIMDGDYKSGLAVIMLEDGGHNRILVFSGANMGLKPEEIKRAFEKKYDAAIVQFEIPQETVIEYCSLAMRQGMPVVVDAGPAQDFPLEKIYGIDILSPNETEVYAMCGIEADTEEKAVKAAKILKDRSGAKMVVIKLGERGALLYSDKASGMFPVPAKVNAVDTTAAGDSFTAAMTVEYIKSGDIGRAIRFANIAAMISVTRLGAIPSLPSMEEITKYSESMCLSW